MAEEMSPRAGPETAPRSAIVPSEVPRTHDAPVRAPEAVVESTG